MKVSDTPAIKLKRIKHVLQHFEFLYKKSTKFNNGYVVFVLTINKTILFFKNNLDQIP